MKIVRTPRPKALIRVKYWGGPYPLAPWRPDRDDWMAWLRRFTVLLVPSLPPYFMLWDKKLDARLLSAKTFPTRVAAWEYLRTTREDDPEYMVEMVEKALDGAA